MSTSAIDQTDEIVEQILRTYDTITVVGASNAGHKAAHYVPEHMQSHGWRIIPVNPFADEVFGVKTVPTLADIDEPVDLVDIFRPARDAAEVVRQAIAIKAPAVWLQSGIVSAEARRLAEEAGIDYVEDRCLAVERAVGSLTKLPGPGVR